jgi:hypothetical protein
MQNLLDNLQALIEPPLIYYAAAVLVLLLALLYLIHRYRTAHKGIIPFKSQGGTIEIAPQTLRGVMQNAANSVEGVEKAACRHFVKGRRVGVKVALHLRANHRLKDVDNCVKARIRATLLDQFGMETVEPIHIRVTRIVGDPVASVPDSEPEPESDSYNNDTPPDADEDERPYSEETRL